MLTAIKLLHTAIWAFLAASILVLPIAGALRRFGWAVIITVIVLLECGLTSWRESPSYVARAATAETLSECSLPYSLSSIYGSYSAVASSSSSLRKVATLSPSRSLKTVTCTPILCVEDDEARLRLRKAALADAGFVVFSATTPSEAMEVLREVPVCLVLSDHMLRGATGTALATEMKKIKPHVPILLDSGSAPETMQHVDGFIDKNEPIRKFLATIREFTARCYE